MLTERANRVLDLEERFPRDTGLKRDAVLNMSDGMARHYQELNRIIGDPQAMMERPMLVKRLLRQREKRVSLRLSRRLG